MQTENRQELEAFELLAVAAGQPLTRKQRGRLRQAIAAEGHWLGLEEDRLLALASVVQLQLSVGSGYGEDFKGRLTRGETLLVRFSARGQDDPETNEIWALLRSVEDGRLELSKTAPAYSTGTAERLTFDEAISRLVPDQPWYLASLAADVGKAGQTRAKSADAKPTPLRRLASLLKPDRYDLLAVVIYAIATGVLLLATPIAVQALVNSIALGGALQPLFVVSALLLLGLLFAGALRGLQGWVVEILQRRVFARLVARIGSRLARADVGWNDHRSAPELVNRFFDVMTIQKTGATLLLDGLSVSLSVLVGSLVLAFYHPLLLAFDLALLVAIVLIVLGPMRFGLRTAVKESSAKYEVAAWFEQLAAHPRMYRTGGAEGFVFRRCDEVARNYLDSRASHYRVVFGQTLASLALHAFASTALLAVGGFLVIQGTLTLGQLVAAELIVNVVLASVSKLGKYLEGYYDLMAATEKVGALLDLPTEVEVGQSWLPPANQNPGIGLDLREFRIEVDRRDEIVCLDGRIAPGGVLGVRTMHPGVSAALGDALWKSRPRKGGAAFLDEQPLGSLHLESVRREVAVLDEPEIVHGSVRLNVTLERPKLSDGELHGILARLGLGHALARLEDGLDTQLSPSGTPLHRDQIFGLHAARCLVGKPRLVVVSGAFLAGCGRLRQEVQELLLGGGWTLLVVTDDEDLLARCDGILNPATQSNSGPVRSAEQSADGKPLGV